MTHQPVSLLEFPFALRHRCSFFTPPVSIPEAKECSLQEEILDIRLSDNDRQHIRVDGSPHIRVRSLSHLRPF